MVIWYTGRTNGKSDKALSKMDILIGLDLTDGKLKDGLINLFELFIIAQELGCTTFKEDILPPYKKSALQYVDKNPLTAADCSDNAQLFISGVNENIMTGKGSKIDSAKKSRIADLIVELMNIYISVICSDDKKPKSADETKK